MDKKRCCYCGKKKTLDQFENKNRYFKGVSFCCIECRRDKNAFAEFSKAERIRESKIKIRCRCKICLKVKDKSEFLFTSVYGHMGRCLECEEKPKKIKKAKKTIDCTFCGKKVDADLYRSKAKVILCDACQSKMSTSVELQRWYHARL